MWGGGGGSGRGSTSTPGLTSTTRARAPATRSYRSARVDLRTGTSGSSGSSSMSGTGSESTRARHHTQRRIRGQSCMSGLPNKLLDEASPTPTGIKKACYRARVHTGHKTHHSFWASGPRPSSWALPSTVRRCRGPHRRRHLRWRALPVSPARRECQPQLFGTAYKQARWDEDSRERTQWVKYSHGMRTVGTGTHTARVIDSQLAVHSHCGTRVPPGENRATQL